MPNEGRGLESVMSGANQTCLAPSRSYQLSIYDAPRPEKGRKTRMGWEDGIYIRGCNDENDGIIDLGINESLGYISVPSQASHGDKSKKPYIKDEKLHLQLG
jgi:hypothetical protein